MSTVTTFIAVMVGWYIGQLVFAGICKLSDEDCHVPLPLHRGFWVLDKTDMMIIACVFVFVVLVA